MVWPPPSRAPVRGGTMVMVGLLPIGKQPVPISLAITRELDLKGSFRFNDEIDQVITALADGSLHIEPVITHQFPLADALHAFEVAKDSTSSGKVLLSFGEGAEGTGAERTARWEGRLRAAGDPRGTTGPAG
ncbi:threonine dehydrogenase-like Zn-dependent dehydrogenase [Pseudarthrobacter defluvii]|nr:threonine dehydrogenase-like Zn-dependent dehydrogenase [Pseudarthrobacter defluvii]